MNRTTASNPCETSTYAPRAAKVRSVLAGLCAVGAVAALTFGGARDASALASNQDWSVTFVSKALQRAPTPSELQNMLALLSSFLTLRCPVPRP